jgi:DNA-binding CsgD family transcriptional regulator
MGTPSATAPGGTASRDRSERALCPLAVQVRAYRDVLVGRPLELDAVRQEALAAKTGRLACVCVEGEPGIGKTRLLTAAQELAEAEGFATVVLAADEELRGPFLLARSIFGCRPVAELAEGTPAQGALERALDAVSGREDPTRAGLPPDERLLATYDAAAVAIAELSALRPLAFLLDDLQWADEDSLRMLRYVVRSDADRPILLVIAMRPEESAERDELVTLVADMERLGYLRRLRLHRFTSAETVQLLRQVLGGPVDATSGATMHAQAEGVPFIVEELAKAYREQGLIRSVDGTWAVARNAARLVPSAVRTLIQRRAARLPEATRALLAYAAVLGRSFSLRDLSALVERAGGPGPGGSAAIPGELTEPLAPALAAGLLVQYPEGSAADYGFPHEQVREFVLGTLPVARRRRAHAAVVELLDGSGEPSPESAAMLAQHARAAGDAEASARFAIQAARAALDRNAPEECLHSVELGLPVVADPHDRVALLLVRDEALGMLRRANERLEGLAEVSALADALRDPRLSLELALRRAAALRETGDCDAAAEVARDVRDRAGGMGDQRLELEAGLQLGQALLRSAIGEAFVPAMTEIDAEGAREAFESTLALALELGDERAAAAAERELGVVAMAHVRQAFLDMVLSNDYPPNVLEHAPLGVPFMEALGRFQGAIEIYDRLGDRHGLMSSILGLTFATAGADFRFTGAVRRLEEIRRLSGRLKTLATESERQAAELHLLYGMHVYAREFGGIDLCLSRGEEAWRKARVLGDRSVESLAAGGMAMGSLQVGDAEAAGAWLDRAAEAVAASPTPLKSRRLAMWRGRLAAFMGEAEGMREHLARAVRLAEEQGTPAGHCEAQARLAIEMARLGAERGDEELLAEAEAAAHRALELVATLPGHPHWSAQAKAALTHVRLARPGSGDPLETARVAGGELRESEQYALFLEIRLPCARAILAGGDPEESSGLRAELQQMLGAVAEQTLDEDLARRWLATMPQAELLEIAGGLDAARAGYRSSPLVASYPALPPPSVQLDERERELLRLMTEAMSDTEIARRIGATEEQVSRQLGEVLVRLNAPSRAAATAFAILQRLV